MNGVSEVKIGSHLKNKMTSIVYEVIDVVGHSDNCVRYTLQSISDGDHNDCVYITNRSLGDFMLVFNYDPEDSALPFEDEQDGETEAKKNIVYLCDRKQCKNCSDTCKHTSDINHAVNFEHLIYDGEHWEKEIPERIETEDCGMILKPLFRLGDYVKCKYNEPWVYIVEEIIYDSDGFSYGISEDQWYGMQMVRECDLTLHLRPEFPYDRSSTPDPKFMIGDKVILDNFVHIGYIKGINVQAKNGKITYSYDIRDVDGDDDFDLPFPYNEEDLIIYSEDNVRRLYTERIEKYNEKQLAEMNRLLEENK